jgi:hypothetical protein
MPGKGTGQGEGETFLSGGSNSVKMVVEVGFEPTVS